MGRMKKLKETKDGMQREIQEAKSVYDDLENKQRQIESDSDRLRRTRDNKDQELEGMSNMKNVLLDKLMRKSKKVFDVYQWLQTNQDKFQERFACMGLL
jgi:FtsZ-binding cell division protein ZapB